MRIVFRVDSSAAIGTGHVARCLALATELRIKKVDVIFICRDLPGNMIQHIHDLGVDIHVLPYVEKALPDAEAWLGETLQEEIEQTAAILSTLLPIDYLIVDHYSLGPDWQLMMKPLVNRLMVIDDYTDREHVCDLYLNQNLTHQTEKQLQNRVGADCELLLGPKYALLRSEFLLLRPWAKPRSGQVQRVLLNFGGSDPLQVTLTALKALLQSELKQARIDVVVGGAYLGIEALIDYCKGFTTVGVYQQVNNIAEFMLRADLAIGAPGSSTWERMALGLPTLLVSFADNQVDIAEVTSQHKLVTYLGQATNIKQADIVNSINELINQQEVLQMQSQQCLEQVDACGVARVSAKLLDAKSLIITLLCPKESWHQIYVPALIRQLQAQGHQVKLVYSPADLERGEIAFFLGLTQLVKPSQLALHNNNLVLHAADLPKGRGWSPLPWQILEGNNKVVLSLFEAVEGVDAGLIYLQQDMMFKGDELLSRLHQVFAQTSIRLICQFVNQYPAITETGREQQGEPSYYPRRTPKDSRLDIDKTIREQFNLLRIVDNKNYPAFFEHCGKTYKLLIEPCEDSENE